MVDVKVLQIVEVVMGTELSMGVVGEPVLDSTEELYVVGRVPDVLGPTIVDNGSVLVAELVDSLGEGDAVFSGLEVGVIDSTLENDSTLEGTNGVDFISQLVVAEIEETELSDSVLEYDSRLVTAEEDSAATSLLATAGDVASDEVVALETVSVVARGGLGVEAGWQSKPTLYTPTSQSSSLPCCGSWKDTETAPPH